MRSPRPKSRMATRYITIRVTECAFESRERERTKRDPEYDQFIRSFFNAIPKPKRQFQPEIIKN